jgi:hypothetical protein
MARRGIHTGIFTPEFLSGDLSRCRGCPAHEIWIPVSGDFFDWFLPGEAAFFRSGNNISTGKNELKRNLLLGTKVEIV